MKYPEFNQEKGKYPQLFLNVTDPLTKYTSKKMMVMQTSGFNDDNGHEYGELPFCLVD